MTQVFEGFAGRGREVARLVELLARLEVLKEFDETRVLRPMSFITEHYYDVPFHGQHHILTGLLYLKAKRASLMAKALWCGHDAEHNGKASRSPEELSAFVTIQWLLPWMKTIELGHASEMDYARVIAINIADTRFPYQWKAQGECGEPLRRTDVFTPLLIPPQYLGVNEDVWTPFRVWLYTSLPLYLERKTDGCRLSLREWIRREEIRFLESLEEYLNLGYFTCDLETTRAIVRNCRRRLLRWVRLDSKILEEAFQFLMDDVTLPEFLAWCDQHRV